MPTTARVIRTQVPSFEAMLREIAIINRGFYVSKTSANMRGISSLHSRPNAMNGGEPQRGLSREIKEL